MHIIARYIFWEVLKIFLVGLTIASSILVFVSGAIQTFGNRFPPRVFASILLYFIPEELRLTIPAAILFASCCVFGRMSGENELLALKSLGINPLVTLWPALVLSFTLSMLTYWLYDVCAAWGRPGMHRTVAEAVEGIAYGYLKTDRSFSQGGISIAVEGVNGRRLVRPRITLNAQSHAPQISLIAQDAELHWDSREQTLRIVCRKGQCEAAGMGTLWFNDTFEQTVPLPVNVPGPEFETPACLTMSQIPGQMAFEVQRLAELESRGAPRVPAADRPAQADGEELKVHRRRLLRLQAEGDRRLANGFSCLCFAVVGAAVAMRLRSPDTLTVFFICFSPILLVYYPLLILGEYVAIRGYLPPYTVWTGNVVVLSVGLGVLAKVRRY